MNKLVKKTVKYSLVFLLLLAVLLLAAPFFIDVNHYKGLIIEKAEQATGRKIEMGQLHASLFPWIGVRLDDVRVANRSGFSDEAFLQIKSLDVQVALLPLLSKRVEIKRFILDSPRLLLERDATGAGNWQDLFPSGGETKPTGVAVGVRTSEKSGNGQIPATSAAGGASLAVLSAKSLRMLNGEVHYRDIRLGRDVTLSEFNVNVDGVELNQPVHVQASGKMSGSTISVKAEVGPLGNLSDLNIERLPLQVDIQAKAIALAQLSHFIPDLKALGTGTLVVNARVEQHPDGLRITAGTLALHGEHDANVAWKLEMAHPDRMKIDHIGIRLEGKKVADMTGSVRGIGRHLQYQIRLNTPTLSRERLSGWIPGLQALYAAHQNPWRQLKLGVLADGDVHHVALRDMQLTLNKELVQVSGNILFASSPVVRLRIASDRLHIDPWLPHPENSSARNEGVDGYQAIRFIPDAHAEAGARIGQSPAGGENVNVVGARIGSSHTEKTSVHPSKDISVNTGNSQEPDLRFLKPWRVIAGLQIKHLFVHGLDLSHLHAAVSGKRGIFTMKPFQFELAGGQVSETARLNVARYPVRWNESVKVRGVQVRPILQALAKTDILAGLMQVDTKLRGIGLLPDSVMKSLNGTGHVLLRNGMIKGFDIAGTLRHVTISGQQNGPKQTDFSQLSGSFKVKDGIASNDDLFMASPLFRLTGYGRVNLVAKNMDYHVKPRLVGTLVGQGDTEAARKGLVIPLRIVGPLNAPQVRVEMNMKTLLGNVGNIKGILKKGGLKGLLKGVLQGGAASPGSSAPTASPVPSQPPAKPVEQILRKLNIPGF